MRIAVISSTVFPCPPPGYSGLEHLAWLGAKGLAARGHQVVLIAPEGSSCPGVEIFPFGPAGGVQELDAYNNYWRTLPSFDAIVDHTWMKCSLNLKMEGKLSQPVLCVCHAPVNTMFQTMPNVEKPCFVCISKDQRDHFNALFSPVQAKYVYNGVDPDFYRPLGIPRSDRYLFLARFSSIKGPDIAIRACKEAGVGLDLIGDTSITNEPEYLHQCLEQCDGKQIRFIGPVKRGECTWWLSQARALLHPNQRFREPFGLAPVEAQLCGCPVIAWRYGAMEETVDHWVTGFLVEKEEHLVSTLIDETVCSLDRDVCREWAMQFDVETMCDNYEKLLLEAVESGGW